MGGGSPNPCQLDFELNLRNYRSQSQFKGAEPWIYPKTKKFKAVVTDKSFFPQLAKVSKKSAAGAQAEGEADQNNNQFTNRGNEEAEGAVSKKKLPKPYSDIFREKNMQKVRHLFEKSNVLPSMQWFSNLRSWHPDKMEPKKSADEDQNNTGKR